mgnify:CR=1 FL=1
MPLSQVKQIIADFDYELVSVLSGGTVLLIPSFGPDLLFWLEVAVKVSLTLTTIITGLKSLHKWKNRNK